MTSEHLIGGLALGGLPLTVAIVGLTIFVRRGCAEIATAIRRHK